MLEETLKNEATRKWFLSKVLAGNIHFGEYNNQTGRIGLIDRTEYRVTAADVATCTLTAGARPLRIKYTSFRNESRNDSVTLTIGATVISRNSTAISATHTHNPVGATLMGSMSAAGIRGPITLNPGETFTQTSIAFVAADATTHVIAYEVI